MDAESPAPPLTLQETEVSHVGSVGSAAYALLFASEPALLETVLCFIGDDEEEQYTRKKKKNEATTFGQDNLFTTIVSLCRAFPTLGQRLSPQNQGFWRTMVLQRFDFTVDDNEVFFNGLQFGNEWRSRGPQEPTHPIRQAIAEFQATHPDDNDDDDEPCMLLHDLVYLSSIGATFRPTEYSFLSEIQQGKATMATWPDREDAYTLYRDLALLQDKLGKLDDLQTWSDDENLVHPCLLSRLDGDVVDGGYELFKHCDFLPFYWNSHMDKRWSGFDHPLPPPVESNRNEWKLRTQQEKAIFPLTPNYRNRFECLRRVVHE